MAVACPKCGSGVADDADECRICGNRMKAEEPEETDANPAAGGPVAGLPGLPGAGVTPSYMAMGSAVNDGPTGSGEMRVSLTGDVIEVPRPAPKPMGPSASGPAPKGGSKQSGPPGSRTPTRGRYGIPEEDEPQGKSVMSIVWTVIFVLMVVGGGGGWFFWNQKQMAPTKAAEKVATALQSADWGTVADSIDISDAQKEQIKTMGGDPATIAKTQLTMLGTLVTFKDVKVGEQTMTGDSATVKMKMTLEGKGSAAGALSGTKDVDWTLKNVNGIWKIDGESFNKALRPGS
ncbi:MAG: hypothetical protein ABJA67_16955 [Chthonomonadales bacterium]